MTNLVFNPGTGTYMPGKSQGNSSSGGSASYIPPTQSNTTSLPPEVKQTSVQRIEPSQSQTTTATPKQTEYKIYYLSGDVIGQPVQNFVYAGSESEAIAKAKEIGRGARFEIVNVSTGDKKVFQPTFTTEQLKDIAQQTGTTFYQVRSGSVVSQGGILPKGYSEQEAKTYNPMYQAHLYDAYKMGNLPKESAAYKFFEDKKQQEKSNAFIEAENKAIKEILDKGYEPIFATASGSIYYIKNPQDFKEQLVDEQPRSASGRLLYEVANRPYGTMGTGGIPEKAKVEMGAISINKNILNFDVGLPISSKTTKVVNLPYSFVETTDGKSTVITLSGRDEKGLGLGVGNTSDSFPLRRKDTFGYNVLSSIITFSHEIEKAPIRTYGEYKPDEPFTTTIQRAAYDTTLFFVSPLWKIPTFLTAEYFAIRGTPEEYSLARQYLQSELPKTTFDVVLMYAGGSVISFIKPPVLQAATVGTTATVLSATIGGKDLKESVAYGLTFGASVGALRMIHGVSVFEKTPKMEFKSMQQDITVSGGRFINVIKAETKGVESVKFDLQAKGFTFDTYSRYTVEGTRITKVFGIFPVKENVKYEGFTKIEYPIKQSRMIEGKTQAESGVSIVDKKVILTTGEIQGNVGVYKTWFGFEPSSAKPIYPGRLKLGDVYLEKGNIQFEQNVKPVGSKSFVLGEFLSFAGNRFYRTGFEVRLKYDNIPRVEKPDKIIRFTGSVKPTLNLKNVVEAPIYDKPLPRYYKGSIGIGVQETVSVKQNTKPMEIVKAKEISVQRVETKTVSSQRVSRTTKVDEGVDYKTFIDISPIVSTTSKVGVGFKRSNEQKSFEKLGNKIINTEKINTPELQIGKTRIGTKPNIETGSEKITPPPGGGGERIINITEENINITAITVPEGGGRILAPGVPVVSLIGGGGGGSGGKGKYKSVSDLSELKYRPSLAAFGLGIKGSPSFAGGIGIRPIVSTGNLFGRKTNKIVMPGISRQRIKTKKSKKKSKEKFGVFRWW